MYSMEKVALIVLALVAAVAAAEYYGKDYSV